MNKTGRKIISVLVCCFLLIGLSGCGKKKVEKIVVTNEIKEVSENAGLTFKGAKVKETYYFSEKKQQFTKVEGSLSIPTKAVIEAIDANGLSASEKGSIIAQVVYTLDEAYGEMEKQIKSAADKKDIKSETSLGTSLNDEGDAIVIHYELDKEGISLIKPTDVDNEQASKLVKECKKMIKANPDELIDIIKDNYKGQSKDNKVKIKKVYYK